MGAAGVRVAPPAAPSNDATYWRDTYSQPELERESTPSIQREPARSLLATRWQDSFRSCRIGPPAIITLSRD